MSKHWHLICAQCVIGKGHTVAAEQHVSLCRQVDLNQSFSDDDTEMPSPGMPPAPLLSWRLACFRCFGLPCQLHTLRSNLLEIAIWISEWQLCCF